ncbi:SAUR-like auxin-responsive protein family [Perilla frutescens var. hirtella]|uniref:SAUR-like auxin-responsive protein family n=1 Tax=Perilla frutescens var. hirtella TaxID=608512 RepID=A0AAD4NWS2_PERFH|nr:SAUR-like auxin-responsive protein family [Perilla frutescens var. hirtella]
MDSTSQTQTSSENKKLGVISKMWKRCKSLSSDGIGKKGDSMSRVEVNGFIKKSKSLPLPRRMITTAEKGSIPIYVGPGPGPEKERFVIKTRQVNHPLFKILLEEAELEYGYAGNNGPLMLPCHVDHFLDVLIQIDFCDEEIAQEKGRTIVARTYSSYHFLTPPRVIALAR